MVWSVIVTINLFKCLFSLRGPGLRALRITYITSTSSLMYFLHSLLISHRFILVGIVLNGEALPTNKPSGIVASNRVATMSTALTNSNISSLSGYSSKPSSQSGGVTSNTTQPGGSFSGESTTASTNSSGGGLLDRPSLPNDEPQGLQSNLINNGTTTASSLQSPPRPGEAPQAPTVSSPPLPSNATESATGRNFCRV